jgi:creatinine amidohydrolase
VSCPLVELTRVELADVAPRAVLVLPFGAIEQHGPHLPFGTDFATVEAIARGAAERAASEAPIVLAPALPYGSSHHHLDVGGALSLSADAFAACARDLLRSAGASGFRRAFVINGHGGNDQLLRVAAAGSDLAVAGGSYWTLAAAALAGMVPPPSPVPGHAGRFETSLALALADGDLSAAPRRAWETDEETAYWVEDPDRWRRIDGYTDSPADGSAEEGSRYLDAITAAVAAAIVDFHRTTEPR